MELSGWDFKKAKPELRYQQWLFGGYTGTQFAITVGLTVAAAITMSLGGILISSAFYGLAPFVVLSAFMAGISLSIKLHRTRRHGNTQSQYLADIVLYKMEPPRVINGEAKAGTRVWQTAVLDSCTPRGDI